MSGPVERAQTPNQALQLTAAKSGGRRWAVSFGDRKLRMARLRSRAVREGAMGHVIFVVLHILAILLGCSGLFITIPLHLIYAAMEEKK